MAVTSKPGVKEAPSSRPPGQARGDPGERRAPYVLRDRHAAKARLKRRASLDALWRLAMTERPSSSEAYDRALLGSYKWPRGPAQPFEKARFAEGKSLDFPSVRLGFFFPWLGFSFREAWIFLPPLRTEGKLSGPTELDEQ